jgi:peptide deformylase
MPTTAAPLEIVLYPDPFLNKPARRITEAELKAGKAGQWDLAELVERMRATMYAAEGIGLAAPQVGVGLRLFLIDVSKERDTCRVLLNPQLSDLQGSQTEEEGCLSIPGVRANVKRALSLKLKAVNLKGEPVEFDASELLARVCQHENDHLDGKLFINKLGMASKFMLRRDLNELEEDYALKQAKLKNKKKGPGARGQGSE